MFNTQSLFTVDKLVPFKTNLNGSALTNGPRVAISQIRLGAVNATSNRDGSSVPSNVPRSIFSEVG